MAVNEVLNMSEVMRWTGKKKAEAVLEIIKRRCTLVDFCRAIDLNQSDVEKWVDDFVKSGTDGLNQTLREP